MDFMSGLVLMFAVWLLFLVAVVATGERIATMRSRRRDENLDGWWHHIDPRAPRYNPDAWEQAARDADALSKERRI